MADITESVAIYTPTGRVATQRLHKDLGSGITGPQVVVVNPNGTPIGGSGGPVTLADGANVTQGALADAAVAAGAVGTIAAKLRAMSRDLVANLNLNSLTPLLLSALTGSAAVKESAAGRLHSLAIFNPNSTDAYVQVFDIALHGSVALGTTVPKLSFWVPALGGYSDSWPAGMAFAAGLSVAATTTPTGAAAVVTGLVVNVLYQ